MGNKENFVKISVKTTSFGTELVSGIMWDYSDLGVSVSDFNDVLELEKSNKTWDYIDGEVLKGKDGEAVVSCFIPKSEKEKASQLLERINALKNSELKLGSLEIQIEGIDGNEWNEKWKENFKPLKIGEIVIVQEWQDYKEKEGEKAVIIGSDMAFGTGAHETTTLCIEFLNEYKDKLGTVIDVGTGSGILGISASKLGAKKVIMTDIDECAVKASKDNVILNGVKNCEVYLKNLLDDNVLKGDVIVCNIMADVLIGFARDIGKNLKDGGIIILSGIIVERLREVEVSYEKFGFKVIGEKKKGEWSAVALIRGE